VVSGFDSDINYAKVAKAVSYLRTPGCLFVSTNTDTGLPCGGDCLLPGNVIHCLRMFTLQAASRNDELF